MYLSKLTEIHRKHSRGMDAASKTGRVLSWPSFVRLLFCYNLSNYCVFNNKKFFFSERLKTLSEKEIEHRELKMKTVKKNYVKKNYIYKKKI